MDYSLNQNEFNFTKSSIVKSVGLAHKKRKPFDETHCVVDTNGCNFVSSGITEWDLWLRFPGWPNPNDVPWSEYLDHRILRLIRFLFTHGYHLFYIFNPLLPSQIGKIPIWVKIGFIHLIWYIHFIYLAMIQQE